MKFKPCIDIHNGKVKQIVGGSLKDAGDFASENFISEKDSAYYAKLFKEDGIEGAHVILLNGRDSEFYEATKNEAYKALNAYPDKLQLGGGVNAENAKSIIEAGAGHVIVTSYVFSDGSINLDNLKALEKAVGASRIVLDLSARRKEDGFYVVTDRWQKFTDTKVTPEVFEYLGEFCDEFLVHGVDMEGKKQGIDRNLIEILAAGIERSSKTVTYAGGIASYEDIDTILKLSDNKLDFTVGSALDLYGGSLSYKELAKKYR